VDQALSRFEPLRMKCFQAAKEDRVAGSRRRQPGSFKRRSDVGASEKQVVLSYWSCEQFNCEFRKITTYKLMQSSSGTND
jgi:hypothetical protein